jgi:hypothetical protein
MATTLVLKSGFDQRKLDSIVAFLRSWDVEVDVQPETKKRAGAADVFSNVRGLWSDYDIDAARLRKDAWGIG